MATYVCDALVVEGHQQFGAEATEVEVAIGYKQRAEEVEHLIAHQHDRTEGMTKATASANMRLKTVTT
jgi:hypothetical protein